MAAGLFFLVYQVTGLKKALLVKVEFSFWYVHDSEKEKLKLKETLRHTYLCPILPAFPWKNITVGTLTKL